MCAKAQGATEYLVLLAVVLIVALVSVALLGFFPGMASDAQRQQSEMYWRSASPIAITEWGARIYSGTTSTYLYLRFRNTGTEPLRITGIYGADGNEATQFSGTNCGVSGSVNLSDYFYMAPGEEKYLAISSFGTACNWRVTAAQGVSSGGTVGGASSLCQNSSTDPGILNFKTLGIEYIAYHGQEMVTKRQIGKQVIIKCLPPG